MLSINEIRKRADSFLEEIYRELYLTESGQKDNPALSIIYERYDDIADKKIIEVIKEEGISGGIEEKGRLKYLLEFIVDNYIGNRKREYEEKILTLQAKAEIKLPEGKMPFRQSEIELIGERDRDRRETIEKAREKVIRGFNPLYEELFNISYNTVDELNYNGYIEMYQETSGIDLYSLSSAMQYFLDATKDIYIEMIGQLLDSRLGIRLEDAKKHDLGHLFRSMEYDRYFSQDKMMPVIKRFTEDAGIDITANGNIIFDIKKREKKSPRAFCAAVRVPAEIYLVIMPHGGLSDWLAFLHELGHSLHYGYAENNIPFEYRRLGDNSVTEGYAFLLEHLLLNNLWLNEYLDIDKSDDFLKFAYIWKLYILRRYASKISYELILHREHNLSEKDKTYSKILTDGTCVKYEPVYYLYDVDPGFYAARYLRAWMFEAQLSSYLCDNFGEEWFRDRMCGKFLTELWREGQRYRVEEIVSQLGYNGLDIEILIKG
ncbi:MAG: hypothetical protein ACE5EA_06275 [Nitrospirota bacterium]